jgi:sec-independent protein translocase protein TatA
LIAVGSREDPFPSFVSGKSATMSVLFAWFGMPGPIELLIIAGILLLLFGGRLPGVMRNLGRGVVEFKKGIQGVEDEVEKATEGGEAEKKEA